MACYSPLQAFKGGLTEKGKVQILWKAPAGTEKISLPCGKCIGCRLSYSKSWAIRCMHEASLYEDNCFVTLTYEDKWLPKDSELEYRDFQLFMKRLRKEMPKKIRFFMAGEYGGQFGRPHYHALLFNCDFKDKELMVERFGNKVYRSSTLDRLWPYGFHSIGDVNMASASYVARYCLKKAEGNIRIIKDEETGKRVQVDKNTGEYKTAEFTRMSRGGKSGHGIAYGWYKKFKGDVFPSDQVVVNGKVNRPPRFYDNLLDKEDPDLLEELKLKRSNKIDWYESTLERLFTKEEVQKAKIKSLVRPLEVNI